MLQRAAIDPYSEDLPISIRKVHLDPPIVEAPASCAACAAERYTKNRAGEAAFRCSSTTMSLREGFTICAKPKDDRPREVALYRQHLKREGKRDPML